ncbi:unnamed protein product [Cuscuta epithymum]|uniref:Transposase MuDR plant domain-containing protein n=1 Tax=Cuscuta epithymum TaxID=186058 RepID=A0AAV0F0Y5_9ASTE|nr:unnamed protein product [Cuscuta epithymum]
MDPVLFVMVKVDGFWDSDYVFINVHTCGLHVNYGVQYTSFVDMLTGMFFQYKPNHNFRLSYMRDGFPPPVTINDQSSLTFYLYIKSLQPDFLKYPLCVEFYPVSSSSAFSVDVERSIFPPTKNVVISPQQLTTYTIPFSSPPTSVVNLSTHSLSVDENVVDSSQQHASSPALSFDDSPSFCTENVNLSGTHSQDVAFSSNTVSRAVEIETSKDSDEDTDDMTDGLVIESCQSLSFLHNFEVITHSHPTSLVLYAIYRSKKDLIHHLKLYAITNHFQYRTKTSRKISLHVICLDPECRWTVRAVRLHGVEMFQIRRFRPEHTCSIDYKQGKHRQATANVIAQLIAHKYLDASSKPYPPKQIREDMSVEYGISMSYKKSWKAQKKAMQLQFGSDLDSYQVLPSDLKCIFLPFSVYELCFGILFTFN